MSIKVIDKCFEADLPPNLKLVLIALSDFGNDEGEGIYPSVDYLAHKTGYSESQTKVILKELYKRGIVTVKRCASKYGTNEYKVHVDKFPARLSFKEERILRRVEARDKANGRGSVLDPQSEGGPILDPQGADFRPPKGSDSDPESLGIHESNREILPQAEEKKQKTKEEFIAESKEIAEAHRKRALEAMARGQAKNSSLEESVLRLFRIRPNWNTKTNREWSEWAKGLPATQTLDGFARWWYAKDWRGKNGQPPTLQNIRELWPQAYPPGSVQPVQPTADQIEMQRARILALKAAANV